MSRVTRDDLLKRIDSSSPYEAVIVAAREARRLNKERIARQTLLGPTGAVGSAPPDPTVGAEPPVAPPGVEESMEEAGISQPIEREPSEDDIKVTMKALDRLAEGEVTYEISQGQVDPEEED